VGTGSDRAECVEEDIPATRPRASGGGGCGTEIRGVTAEVRPVASPLEPPQIASEIGVVGGNPDEDVPPDHAAGNTEAGEQDDEAEQSGALRLKAKVGNFNRFIDETVKGLDPISALIWLTLFRFARGGIAWASQETIAKRLGINSGTVSRHIHTLEEKKLLRVLEKGRRGGKCNTYQLGILPLEPVAKRPERSGKKPRQGSGQDEKT